MSTAKFPLSMMQIASPCAATWDEMSGDDQVRFCGRCAQHVYDLSDMTRAEAETLLEENEGQACLRFYRRRDGKIMTKDCAIGVQTAHRASFIGHTVMATFFGIVGLVTLGWLFTSAASHRMTMGKPCPRREAPAPVILPNAPGQ